MRRWTANLLCFVRVGLNPILIVNPLLHSDQILSLVFYIFLYFERDDIARLGGGGQRRLSFSAHAAV